jgi:hypothetical protein
MEEDLELLQLLGIHTRGAVQCNHRQAQEQTQRVNNVP